MKKVLTVFILLMMVFLASCQGENYGAIKNFYVEDSVMHWSEVRRARYYNLKFYSSSDFDNVVLEDVAYTNQWDGLIAIDDGTPIYLIIEAVKSEMESSFSDQISFVVDKEYPNPFIYLSPGSSSIEVIWDSLDEVEGFRNFTVDYNGMPIVTDGTNILIEDDSVLLSFDVLANFEDGSTSLKSPKIYIYTGLSSNIITMSYDLDSNDDLEIDFSAYADIIAITNNYTYLKGIYDSPKDVYWIETETVIINKFFLQVNYEEMVKSGSTRDLAIITDSIVYYIDII